MKRLPKAQHDMIRLWVLGGADAIGHHSTQTVRTLLKSGYLDKNGPTAKAVEYVNRHEVASLQGSW